MTGRAVGCIQRRRGERGTLVRLMHSSPMWLVLTLASLLGNHHHPGHRSYRQRILPQVSATILLAEEIYM